MHTPKLRCTETLSTTDTATTRHQLVDEFIGYVLGEQR
jgi:hypothetical protein